MKSCSLKAIALLFVVTQVADAAFTNPVVRTEEVHDTGKDVSFFPQFRKRQNARNKGIPTKPEPVAPHHVANVSASKVSKEAEAEEEDDDDYRCLLTPKDKRCDGLFKGLKRVDGGDVRAVVGKKGRGQEKENEGSQEKENEEAEVERSLEETSVPVPAVAPAPAPTRIYGFVNAEFPVSRGKTYENDLLFCLQCAADGCPTNHSYNRN